MSGIKLLISDRNGIYIPQMFANFDHSIRSWGIDHDDVDLQILRAGPDNEYYWDAWNSVCERVFFTDSKGNFWYLYADGDLWLTCDALMTKEEYKDFYGQETYDHHEDLFEGV